jgi:NADH:ubiquinone oxidoreductase subunit F (NADH-binding)
VSPVASVRAPEAPTGAVRLLRGLTAGASDTTLPAHLERWGDLPLWGHESIRDELHASGLRGRGGAWFPVGAKWDAIARASRRPVVVANCAEGEPASRKDALLASQAPHLVLDGLTLAASSLRARRAFVYAPTAALPSIQGALAERAVRGLDPFDIEVVESPPRFLAGQESAVVNALNGRRDAVPSFTGITTIRDRGVAGRPTLVQNAETLAHAALIGRFGAGWYRTVGTDDFPGTMLLTVNRAEGTIVVEVAMGSPLLEGCGLTHDQLSSSRGVLLGGYGGGWVTPAEFCKLVVAEGAVRGAGATLGTGVVAVLPNRVCPLAEMADVVRFMQGEGAGQCGPCVHGLDEIAQLLEGLAHHGRGAKRSVQRLWDVCGLTEGRGACRHPDGVVRFVRSGLTVFKDEIRLHQRDGACALVGAPRFLPVPSRATVRRLTARP